MKRNNCTAEFKSKVGLELLREEKTVSQVAAEYGVHPNLISRWKAEFENNYSQQQSACC
jgi:transposase-like protein